MRKLALIFILHLDVVLYLLFCTLDTVGGQCGVAGMSSVLMVHVRIAVLGACSFTNCAE